MIEATGEIMYKWASELFPVNRSLTGEGVRKTLYFLQNIIADIKIHEVPSGYRAFDWEVPKEWNVTEGYIQDEEGKRIVDFKENNLHLVGYSIPIKKWVSLDELNPHLYSLPDQPNAIPYVTSYYEERWGFCLSHRQRESLKPGKYYVHIKSELKPGVLNYGELIIPGKTDKEVLISTYICHPSMANNELSGPVIAVALAQWIMNLSNRKYTYRIIFIPETIGSIVYLSKHVDYLKKHVYAGFNLTCLGDERCYSFLPTRKGGTISDKVAKHVLQYIDPDYKAYTWFDRGSDERQYCAPGVDLPIATIMRSKYGEYPEYHTSLDNLDLISAKGLNDSYLTLKSAIEILEKNELYSNSHYCEPMLSKYGLYSTISSKGSSLSSRELLNILSMCDGENDIIDIANKLNVFAIDLLDSIGILKQLNLIK